MTADQNTLKAHAAQRAVDYIKSGMTIGLGTGSTANFALQAISAKLKSGELSDIVGIPSSLRTETLARQLDIPLTSFKVHPTIDLTIDGADEVDDDLNLIKGGGGALLREKVIAQASTENIIVVDDSKLSTFLGEKWAVPIEVTPFAAGAEQQFLRSIGAETLLRKNSEGQLYLTDQQNWIIDARFSIIEYPAELEDRLNRRAGIVEHGLFVGTTTRLIIAGADGLRELTPADGKSA